ncbi:MAG: hypothetical protein IJ501_04075 [Bacilli bacterium]|nr:hypothetical protein [Bacilli bacterium]
MRNQYLIPANTKKGGLIFGIFMPADFWIAGIGVGITVLALAIMATANVVDNFTSILGLLPALIAVFLVFPFPNYHNVRTAIGEVIAFYSNRQKYVWRGWCSSYEFKDK